MARRALLEITHQGGCHCGAVRFQVRAPARITVQDCNCSICRKSGFLHLIVDKAHFTLLKGHRGLATYRFNTGAAKHFFCKVCGIKSFYVPRSHPDGVSVNVRCLDPGTVKGMKVRKFNGADWEKAARGKKWAR